jgi:YidC/Oxa1 family membrane protein insertase
MRQNAFNFILFLFLASGAVALWFYAENNNWFPKNEVAQKDDEKKDAKPDDKKDSKKDDKKPEEKKKEPAKKAEPKPPAPVKFDPPELIQLGGDGFFIQSLLSTQGAGVQQVMLPRFKDSDRLGRPVPDTPLYLIPGIRQPHGVKIADNPPTPRLQPGFALDPADPRTPDDQRIVEPSYAVYHYPSEKDNYPDPHLGTVNWKVVKRELVGDTHTVVFETTLGEPHFLKLTRTYTLGKGDYHLGMKLEFERLPGGKKGDGGTRFQIAGPRHLPVEGEWYTALTRVSLIGYELKKGGVQRQYDDATSIGTQRGGEKLLAADNTFKYAAIATQYFASALAIHDDTGTTKWAWVRSTSELGFAPPPDEMKKLEEDFRNNPNDPVLAAKVARFRPLLDRKLPELDDITFRAVTDPIDLGPGETLAHSYAIYNGPSKVALLSRLPGENRVRDDLVNLYVDNFKLDTLTDYHSPTLLGKFARRIGWSWIVINCTNLMHWLLWAIHSVIGSWGLSIIVLTIMVRLLLFIPSRKQTQMNMRMMEIQKKLKPELDKLHEKYKDDFQTYNREKTRLMMQHGMNPFAAMGGCLLLFAQMPIMMGLYYCLQESIFFRLEPFAWVNNLSAPDMTVWWTENVPLISDPENRWGTFSFLYLGPYLNILPLIAVSLMLYQQNKMMPPPTDEQQAAQQRMMKIMMIVVAFMFYKVAAGLALYFIISTSWGLIERQFIPKPGDKPADDTGTGAELLPKGGPSHGEPAKPKGFMGKFRQRLQDKIEELQKRAEEQSSRQVRNDPNRPQPFRKDKKKRK